MWESLPQSIVSRVCDMKPITTKCDGHSLTLPDNFFFAKLSINDDLQEIFEFLQTHYTKNNHSQNVYSKQLLNFFFSQHKESKLLGIRTKNEKNLIGFISGVLQNVNFLKMSLSNIVIVNFLCVHKQYRNKSLTNFLVNHLWTSFPESPALFYTTSTLPCSFTSIQYYACPVNVDNLLKSQYFQLPPTLNDKRNLIEKLKHTYRICDDSKSRARLQQVCKTDLTAIQTNITKYLSGMLSSQLTHDIFLRMYECSDFYQFCSSNYQNYVALFVTTEIRKKCSLKIGQVYLFYTNDDTQSFKNDVLRVCKRFCDLIVFPHSFKDNFPSPLPLLTLNFHLFNHSTIHVPPSMNYFPTL